MFVASPMDDFMIEPRASHISQGRFGITEGGQGGMPFKGGSLSTRGGQILKQVRMSINVRFLGTQYFFVNAHPPAIIEAPAPWLTKH